MSKGSKRRPCLVSNKEYADNYDKIFNGIEPETPVECTAIVKYVPPDLTKMDHPTACKYLEVGMKVKILCKHVPNERKKWAAGWPNEMDEFVGRTLTIFLVNKNLNYGVSFVEDDMKWDFPAFCLQIIEQENKNDS